MVQISDNSLKECFSELFCSMVVFLLTMALLLVLGHPFLLFTSHSLTNRVPQSTDVMFAVLLLVRTSKGSSRILHIVIMIYFLKWQQYKRQRREKPKKRDNQNMASERWINVQGQEKHVCM